jgi:hypothetical protein
MGYPAILHYGNSYKNATLQMSSFFFSYCYKESEVRPAAKNGLPGIGGAGNMGKAPGNNGLLI